MQVSELANKGNWANKRETGLSRMEWADWPIMHPSRKYEYSDVLRSESDLDPNTKIVRPDLIFSTKLKSSQSDLKRQKYDENTNRHLI